MLYFNDTSQLPLRHSVIPLWGLSLCTRYRCAVVLTSHVALRAQSQVLKRARYSYYVHTVVSLASFEDTVRVALAKTFPAI